MGLHNLQNQIIHSAIYAYLLKVSDLRATAKNAAALSHNLGKEDFHE